ncbi:cysteine-rich receptor-like protein kinase 8 [Tanacetum coccineum]
MNNGDKEQRKRLIQFLMGLDECYSNLRGQILLLQPLPIVDVAYNIIRQEEKQREGILPKPLGSIILSAQTYTSKPNRLKGYPIGHPQHGKYKPLLVKSVNVNDNKIPKVNLIHGQDITTSSAKTEPCTSGSLDKRISNGNLCEGLYIIYPDQATLTSPTVLTNSKDNTKQWNSRLGHPSTSTLKQIKSISTSCNFEISNFNVCPLAKNHASPFSLSTSHASSPFELFSRRHMGVWRRRQKKHMTASKLQGEDVTTNPDGVKIGQLKNSKLISTG